MKEYSYVAWQSRWHTSDTAGLMDRIGWGPPWKGLGWWEYEVQCKDCDPEQTGQLTDRWQLFTSAVKKNILERHTGKAAPLWYPPPPVPPTLACMGHRDGKLTITMMKSSQHQTLVKYFPNPKATHFRPISRIKMYVKIWSVQLSNAWILGRFSRWISSNTWNDKA